MKINAGARSGFALGQIAAILLVVLPTLAFIVMLTIEYWRVMRIQNNLELANHVLSRYVASQTQPVRDWSAHANILNTASQYCPKDKTLTPVSTADNNDAQIHIEVSYDFSGKFFSQTLTSRYDTFSLYDQNLTATFQCQTQSP